MTALGTRRLAAGAALLTLLFGAAGATGPAAAATDPWRLLAGVRDRLDVESPLQATFSQTFVPSGFSTGDMESGTLFVDLPRCLRFAYREPFAKDFLLCGDWIYTWNPGEPSGRRFLVNDSEAEGLELLRLEVDALRARYRAELGSQDGGRTTIRLIPLDPAAELKEASVEIGAVGDPDETASGRLLALAYEDRSGNHTRFEIGGYGGLSTRAELEAPDLEWLDD